jgi:hypothetical protein
MNVLQVLPVTATPPAGVSVKLVYIRMARGLT